MEIRKRIAFARNMAWYAQRVSVKDLAETGGSVDFMNIVFEEFVDTTHAEKPNTACNLMRILNAIEITGCVSKNVHMDHLVIHANHLEIVIMNSDLFVY